MSRVACVRAVQRGHQSVSRRWGFTPRVYRSALTAKPTGYLLFSQRTSEAINMAIKTTSHTHRTHARDGDCQVYAESAVMLRCSSRSVRRELVAKCACAAASLRLRLEQGPHPLTVLDTSFSEHHEAERCVDQTHAADAEPQGKYRSGARRRSAHAWANLVERRWNATTGRALLAKSKT